MTYDAVAAPQIVSLGDVLQLPQVEQVEGNHYAKLSEVVHNIQDDARSKVIQSSRRALWNRSVNLSPPRFVCFEEQMVRSVADQDGEVQWVLKDQEKAWLEARAAKARP